MTAAPPSAPADRKEGRTGSGRHRRKRRRRSGRQVALVGSATALVVAAAGYFHFSPGRHSSADGPAGHAAPDAEGSAGPSSHPSSNTVTAQAAAIRGLGPATRASIPSSARQVVVASGAGKDSSHTTVTLWTKTGSGTWSPGASWPAHNALRGWTRSHHVNDLHSPIGVFTLSDAGGFKPNPGTRLPYHRSSGFAVGGTGFHGEALNGSFDYVVAINYNRVPGTSPLDAQQPMGSGRGGGIWIHVDHGGPTHGCVSLAKNHMVQLLRTLDPHDHPVIVMGDHGSLAA